MQCLSLLMQAQKNTCMHFEKSLHLRHTFFGCCTCRIPHADRRCYGCTLLWPILFWVDSDATVASFRPLTLCFS